MEIRFCLNCKKEIIKPIYRISEKSWKKRKYCCAFCKDKNHKLNSVPHKKWKDNWKYKKELHFCPKCWIEKRTPNWKICKKCLNKTYRWKLHPNFKHGKPQKRQYCYEYKKWRMWVFKRDWFTCKERGYKWKKIQAHHIKQVKDYPTEIYNINNGITLCVPCHNKTRNKEKLFEEHFLWKINANL